jgi:signal transduction histidine kinase
MDLVCNADLYRLTQVLRNLFDNSLAAGATQVKVTIRCSNDSLDNRPAVRIVVSDNGPGLDSEQRRHVFEPFYTTKTKGTGLGMAIARRIVEAHGGQISLGYESASGAEFLILLPSDGP